jgi:hypothetical protein
LTRDLPTGTATFLFTEGSTSLLAEMGADGRTLVPDGAVVLVVELAGKAAGE